jgi:hypothetical protein
MPVPASLVPLLLLLAATLLLIPLDRQLLGLPVWLRLVLGLLAVIVFALTLARETSERRLKYLALAAPLLILSLAPIDTRLTTGHLLALSLPFVAVLVIPPLMLRRPDIITFKFWPDKLDWLDIIYTLISIPLAWAAFKLYFGLLSPEVPFNWALPAEPDNLELFKLFMGINAVGVWDELFFVNICFAVLRSLFPFRIANPAQAVIYTSILYDMAFSGWGPVFVYALALTQGAMFERSRALLWVLLVHLIADYFLFQAIVSHYYPALAVWWH